MLTDAREKAENLRMKAEAEQYAIVERNRAKKAQLEAASAQAQLYADEIKQGLTMSALWFFWDFGAH